MRYVKLYLLPAEVDVVTEAISQALAVPRSVGEAPRSGDVTLRAALVALGIASERSQKPMKLPTGTVVKLLSGGPAMTVTGYDDASDGGGRECKWFAGIELKEAWMEPACLTDDFDLDEGTSVVGVEHEKLLISRQRLAEVARRVTAEIRNDPLVIWGVLGELLIELEVACEEVPIPISEPVERFPGPHELDRRVVDGLAECRHQFADGVCLGCGMVSRV